MTTIVGAETSSTREGPPGPETPAETSRELRRRPRPRLGTVVRSVLVIAVLGLLSAYVGWDTMASTIVRIIIAVGISAAVFVAANKLFDQAYPRWVRFNTLAGFALGFLAFAVLGNNGALRRLLDRIIFFEGQEVTLFGVFGPYDSFGPYDLNPWIWGAIGGVALGLVMFLLSAPRQQLARLPLAVIGFGGFGLLTFVAIAEDYRPSIDWPKLIICTVVGAGIFGGLRLLRGPRDLAGLSALSGVVIGYTIGAWGGGEIGRGNALGGILATVVPGVLLGVRAGLAREATALRRRAVDQRSRSWIFLLPALLFIAGGLLLPLIRTAWLSFRDDSGAEWIGGEHYRDIFSDRDTLDLDEWTNMFTSRLFFFGAAFLAIAVFVGIIVGRRLRSGFETSASKAPMAIGLFFLGLAVFAAIRGTISNNLWWVLVVTTLATVLGLAVAVLADRSRGENVAKSFIFLPMAISFVGAGIIWRFMYQARPASDDQTGVMNALWVGLGELSHSSSVWHWLVAAMFGIALIGLALLVKNAVTEQKGVMLGVSAFLFLAVAYCGYLFIGPGLGGAVIDDGEIRGDPILFLEDRPFNNIWLMVVLIWIQTGFAMVIFSSAIKAVPTEFTEAAKVDGATESQIFWKITVPQIAPTIGVVVTTLMITVLKVFDIVRVMTGGVNDTEVIANRMISRFGEGNFGNAAALAMILFVAVLPIMFVNVRRMRKS